MSTLLLVALAAAPEPVTIVRKHAVGQKYGLEYTNVLSQPKTTKTFKGTAVVKSVEEKTVNLDATVDSLEWNGPDGKRSGSGVKLKVAVHEGAVSATVVSPGTLGEDADFELTAFEQMLGDLCMPPKGPFYAKTPVVGRTTWDLLSKPGPIAKLRSAPSKDAQADADVLSCDLTISVEDGFTGERTGRAKVPVAQGKFVDQKQTLKVKKL